LWLFLLSLFGIYIAGGLLYEILGALGLPGFATSDTAAPFLKRVAAGAPDVQDHRNFLERWMQRPVYTEGRTFVGGLVPGNFEWNPSVWTHTTVNPGTDMVAVTSGGFRLQSPVWGYVSFGWPGVVGVCGLSGLLTGTLAGIAKRLLPMATAEASMAVLVIYIALQDILPGFYTLSYLAVVAVAVLVWVFAPPGAPLRTLVPAGRTP
jgi:hypothetical protein